jgi:hypothetical protein
MRERRRGTVTDHSKTRVTTIVRPVLLVATSGMRS